MGLVTELGLDACLQAKCSFSRVLVDLQFFLLGLLCFLFVCLFTAVVFIAAPGLSLAVASESTL